MEPFSLQLTAPLVWKLLGLAELPKVQSRTCCPLLSLRKPATAAVKRWTTTACHPADPMTQTAGSTSIESSQFIRINVVSPTNALVPLKSFYEVWPVCPVPKHSNYQLQYSISQS